MRVLIIGLNFYPELTGIGKYTGEMAEYFSEQGLDVRVVTAPPYYPYWKVQKPYSSWRYTQEKWNRVKIFRSPLWVPRKITGFTRLLHLASFAFFSLPIILSQIFWKPQVVFSIVPTYSAVPFALLAARLSRSKSWVHIQDFEIDAAFQLGILGKDSPLKKLAFIIEEWLLNSFDMVSTISNRMGIKLVEKGVDQAKILTLVNWVDTDLIYPIENTHNSFRKKLGISEDDIVVLYAGNMGQKQGLETLVEAAIQLQEKKEIHFVFCGEGKERQVIEKKTHQLGNVQLIPLQPLEHLNELLNMADIHILPQRADAADLVMPSKFSGMLASGKAVITTANHGTELATVAEQTGMLVPPQDVSSLVEGILKLAENHELRASLGKQGRAWVEKHWSKDQVLLTCVDYLEKRVNI